MTVASVGEDTTVRLWDGQTGFSKAALAGHTDPAYCCAFSPDGRTVASASSDGTVRLWDARTGEVLAVYPCLGAAFCCAFGPSHGAIACGDNSGNLYVLRLYGFDDVVPTL